MPVEIEAKLKVEHLALVQDRLRKLEAQCLEKQEQMDLYCDNAHGDMIDQDKSLRIRLETTEASRKTLITYKGPKQESDVKCREEIEFPLPDLDQARALLEGLGYTQKLTVHKQREVWAFKRCLIGLDQVTDLGTYVEIEGPSSEVVHEVQTDLGLDHIPHCQESYACLISQKSKVQSPES